MTAMTRRSAIKAGTVAGLAALATAAVAAPAEAVPGTWRAGDLDVCRGGYRYGGAPDRGHYWVHYAGSVKNIQSKLGGLAVDGVFGTATRAKVIAFQRSRRLTADGIVGIRTASAMNLGWGGYLHRFNGSEVCTKRLGTSDRWVCTR